MMVEGSSDMIAYILLVVLLATMGLASWLRYRILPTVRSASPSLRRPSDSSESPVEIPDQRYAHGEIANDEYEELRHMVDPGHRA